MRRKKPADLQLYIGHFAGFLFLLEYGCKIKVRLKTREFSEFKRVSKEPFAGPF